MLLDDQTLLADKEGEYNFATGDNDRFFSINPQLAKYIKIKQGDKEISLDELHIEINTEEYEALENYDWFIMYLNSLERAKQAAQKEPWDDKDEIREEYIARMMENAERHRFDLMLTDHSWQQYMEGWVSGEVASNAIEQEILAVGDYYSYVEKLDAPEKEKEKLIRAYEKAYNDEIVQMDEEYPGDKGWAEKNAWIEKKMKLVEQFKQEHPDYPELARKHAAENARKAREGITNQ